MLIRSIKMVFFMLLVFANTMTAAQELKSKVKITPLTRIDQQQLNKEVEAIDDIARLKLGTQLHRDKSDIGTLQRIVDEKLIDKSDSATWQAAGVVLGNVLVSELKNLQWYLYQDREGTSRALCVPDTDQCLFPTTMLSRRVEAEASVDVQKIHDNAYELIKPHVEKANSYQSD